MPTSSSRTTRTSWSNWPEPLGECGEHRVDEFGRVAGLEEDRGLGDDPVRADEDLRGADAALRC